MKRPGAAIIIWLTIRRDRMSFVHFENEMKRLVCAAVESTVLSDERQQNYFFFDR